MQQLEIFYRTLILDVYRREKKITFEKQDNIEKRYFIVPLRLAKQPLDPSHIRHDGQRSVLTYHIDTKLLQKTERLYFNGYKNEQSGNVIEWLRSKGLLGTENLETQ